MLSIAHLIFQESLKNLTLKYSESLESLYKLFTLQSYKEAPRNFTQATPQVMSRSLEGDLELSSTLRQ